MSHLTTMDVKVDDIDALKKALEEMGYGWIDGPKTITSPYDWELNADLQVTKNGSGLPVGFIKQSDGSYRLEADWWNLNADQTKFKTQLSQLHAKHKLLNVAKEKGYKLESTDFVKEDGKKYLKLTLSAWDTEGDSIGGTSFGSNFGSQF